MTATIFGAIFGLLSVVFGAFGAHALKKKFTDEQQQSFETGVKYQMYHALVLLYIGQFFSENSDSAGLLTTLFVVGTLLFSFSIYGLCLSAAFGRKLRFLGPVTPLGGLCLVAGWAVLLYHVLFH